MAISLDRDQAASLAAAEPGIAPGTTPAEEPGATRAAAPPGEGFDALGLDATLLATLAALGYEEPTPIQREAIPPLLAGRDVLAQAPTGTGKTAAFALPAIQRLAGVVAGPGAPTGLVLVPTRELAMQVAQAIHTYGRQTDLRVMPVYGGQPIGHQLTGLRRGVHVVVATPGRALDHLRRESLRLDRVRLVVLDEADEMLDMGFAEDLEAILGAAPKERQTALFSATIPPPIRRLAELHLSDPVRLAVHHEPADGGAGVGVRQVAYVVQRAYKLAALGRILDLEGPTSTLVFARTRTEVDELADALAGRGYDAGALHGGMSQEQRDRVMGRFREGSLALLVATDVAARGLDIERVSHVVNFDVPSAPDEYVHRIGRTARAGRSGTAITLVEPREHRLLRNIEAATKTRLEMATLPTVADLRARRHELLGTSVREALLTDDLDRFRPVVEALADEFDLVDIALAALSLAAGDEAHDDDVELPPARLPQVVAEPTARWAPGPGRGSRPAARAVPRGQPSGEPARRPRPDDRPFDAPRRANGPTARIWVGAGRAAGIRPADLVGAIANEAGLPGSMIGPIQVSDRFSLVDVPGEAAESVVRALRDATIRGRRVVVRRVRTADRSEG